MRTVAMGSRAEAGSSMRMTSGSTAMARAIQSRCCCPPGQSKGALLQLVLHLVPERRAPKQRSTSSSSSPLSR